MNYLDILTRASIDVAAAAENIKLPNAGTQIRVTVFPSKTIAQYSGVPWWIILVAILAGILMLALLVFLLWKVSPIWHLSSNDLNFISCFLKE